MTRAYARFVVATVTLLVAIILPASAHASLCATRAFSPHDSRPALGPRTGLPRAPAARSARTRLGERRGEATPVGATTHPLRMKRGGASVFFELDLAGNVRRLRGSGGTDLGRYRYSAFGTQLEDTASASFDQPFRWKGRPRDVLGGVETYDMRARVWIPAAGVFDGIDELAFHSSRTTLWAWPGQSPVRWSDPAGREAIATATLLGLGASSGAGAGATFAGVSAVILPAAFVAVGVTAIGAAAWDISHQIDEFQHPTVSYAPSDLEAKQREAGVLLEEEHTKNARPSTEDDHEKGMARKKRDKGGEKGDKRRKFQRSNKKKKYQGGAFAPYAMDQDEEDGSDAEVCE